MGIIEGIILGIIQGLTEFLPVSSSGHLEIGKAILGDDSIKEQSMFFTVATHFATALATIIIFRKEIAEILKGLFQFKKNKELFFSIKIILSMIPAAVVGLLFEEEIERLFTKNILLVGSMLILTGLILFLADKAKNTDKKVSFSHAVIIGIAQAIAILPGISRSGATISTSVLLGIDRTRAARFSFLMVIPLIFGKMAKDVLKISCNCTEQALDIAPTIAGFIAALVVGIFACKWMITLVRNSQLRYFAYYCLIVGAGSIIYTFL